MAQGKPSGLQQLVTPSKELAEITGPGPLNRMEVTQKVWNHIREKQLQDPNDKREIIPDDKLRAVVGEDRLSMFELTKHISRHLSAA
jgi:chromatin remodeling complex protein RSC6